MTIIEELNKYMSLQDSKQVFSFNYPYKYIECKIEDYKNKCSQCNSRKLKYAHYLKHIDNDNLVIIGYGCFEKIFGKKYKTYIKNISNDNCIKCDNPRDSFEFIKRGLRKHPTLCYSCFKKKEEDLSEERRVKLELKARQLDKQARIVKRELRQLKLRNSLKYDEFPCYVANCEMDCYQCNKKLRLINNGKDPFKMLNKSCKECNKGFTRRRFEKYKKLCLDCYKK